MPGLQRARQSLKTLLEGPETPRDDGPTLLPRIFPRLEAIPLGWSRIAPVYRVACLAMYCLLCIGISYNIIVQYYTLLPQNGSTPVVSLGCLDQLEWRGKNGQCGFQGEKCVPDDKEVLIRCPALCDRSWTYSLMPVGEDRVKYRSFVIGGGVEKNDDVSHPYRADSFTCAAAVHAGFVSPFNGGCARVTFGGAQASFPSYAGAFGTDASISFDSFFKYSFRLGGFSGSHCHDPRIPYLILNILLLIPVVYSASGAAVYWITVVSGFWTIILATDPPLNASPETFPRLLSLGFERFLPCCFILYVLWHSSVKNTLSPQGSPEYVELSSSPSQEDLEARENAFSAQQSALDAAEEFPTTDYQEFDGPYGPGQKPPQYSYLSRLLLWYPMFWLGVLNNVTFDRLPVDRLTAHDLATQPGALVAVLGIVGLISTCALIQAYYVWKAGKFYRYLRLYAVFAFGLFILSNLPGLTLRVHHYILALILIPGCSTRGSTALLFQGVLLGLFLSGAARWGLASIVETEAALRRDDPSGFVLPPKMLAYNSSSGLLTWEAATVGMTEAQKKVADTFSEISLLVNDIEYFHGDVDSLNVKKLIEESELSELVGLEGDEFNIYLRLGRKVGGEDRYSDFGNAAVLGWPSGEFRLPGEGLT